MVAQPGRPLVHTDFLDLPNHLARGDLLIVNASATLPAALPARRERRHRARPAPLHTRPGAPGPLGRRAAPRRPPRPGDAPRRSRSPPAATATLLAPYLSPGRLWIAQLDLPEPLDAYLARPRRPDPLRPRDRSAPARGPPDDLRHRARQRGDAERRPPVHQARARRTCETTGSASSGSCSTPASAPRSAASARTPSATASPPTPRPASTPTRQAGHRVIAVGTTVVRALETVAEPDGSVRAGQRLDEPDRHARARRPRRRRPAHRLARARGQPPADARGLRRPQAARALLRRRAGPRLPLARVRRSAPAAALDT